VDRRRFNAYFVTEKWVYDKAARRIAKKAHEALGGAERHLMNTSAGFAGPDAQSSVPFWQELAEEDAFKLLKAAGDRVNKAEEAAHKVAKAKL
jgi:hypothetical protein